MIENVLNFSFRENHKYSLKFNINENPKQVVNIRDPGHDLKNQDCPG